MKRTLLIAAAALTLVALAGCTGSGSSEFSSSGAQSSEIAPQSSGGGANGLGPTTTDGFAADAPADNRAVITTGSMSVTAVDPIRAAQDAATITEQADGRVDERTENPSTGNQPASASLTLRIPSQSLDRTLADLKQLGTVNFVSLSSADITQQTVDLDARITSLQTSVDRLLGLMTQTASTADLISVENALAQRQSELEGLTSQRTYLSDQIEYSTLTLTLVGEGVVAPESPNNFWSALAAGWAALLAAGSGLLLVLGFALPGLVVLAVLAGVVLLIVRSTTRRRRRRDDESHPHDPNPPGGSSFPAPTADPSN